LENKTEIMQNILKMQKISLLPEYPKLIFGLFFLHVFTYMYANLLKVK